MPAVRHPSWFPSRKVFVRIRDARIVLIAELIVRRVWVRITTLPELLDELVALLIVREVLKCLRLFIGYDPAHVLIHPGLVLTLQLSRNGLLTLPLLRVAEAPLQRVRLLFLRLRLHHPAIVLSRRSRRAIRRLCAGPYPPSCEG